MLTKIINLFSRRLTKQEIEESRANLRCAALCEAALVKIRKDCSLCESQVIDCWLEQISDFRKHHRDKLSTCLK